MDPNEVLAKLAAWANDPFNSEGAQSMPLGEETAAELFQMLDEHLVNGGALPVEWDAAQAVESREW